MGIEILTLKQTKEGFFDRDKVMRALGKATYKVLNDYGRFVRSTAQKSLEYKDGPSDPGRPPHVHKTKTITRKSKGKAQISKKTGKVLLRSVSLLRERLYYAYDTTTKTVVVGPTKITDAVSANEPHVLEYGGTSRIRTKVYEGKLSGYSRTTVQKRDRRGRFLTKDELQHQRAAVLGKASVVFKNVNIRPRPFMHPAAKSEERRLPSMLRGSVK